MFTWLAFVGVGVLASGCTRAGQPPPEPPPMAQAQEEPPSNAAPRSAVHCAIIVDRELAGPGETITLSATLTPDRSGPYDLQMFVAAPDGSRVQVTQWDAVALEQGVPANLSAPWPVPAEAPEGVYGVSLTLVSQDGSQESGNVASFRVSASGSTEASTSGTSVTPAGSTPTAAPKAIAKPARGIAIAGRHLVDGRGRVFVPRGPELVTAELDRLKDIDAIAATGANALRMLLTLDTANHMTPEAFDQLIGRAVGHKLVVWISLFTWDDSREREIAPALGGGHLRKMSDYLVVWERKWLKDLVKKYDGWVVVDAMQEFKSTIQPPEDPRAVREWVEAAKQHIRFFRNQGFTQPLEIMTSFEGRDLHAIIANADEILAADTLTQNGTKQTLFGWQAYWGPGFYEHWQGGLLAGRPITASEAVKKFVATRNYPIMVGLDSVDVPGTESHKKIMPACAAHSVGWLWWEWDELKSEAHGRIVRTTKNGFAGARRAAN